MPRVTEITSETRRPNRLSLLTRLAQPGPFSILVVVNAALLWLIIPSGALVRLTGSGLGCPDWPLCDGGVVPETGYHATIEYTNRLFSAAIIVVSILTWLVSRKVRGGRPRLSRLALAATAMTVAQVPLGGVTVLTDLHPLMVGSHFTLSLAALWVGVLLVLATQDHLRGRTRRWDRRRGPYALFGLAALTATLLTGVLTTAAGPHSGDDDVTRRFGNLADAAWVHVRAVGVLVAIMLVLAVWLWRERPADPAVMRLAGVFLPLLAVQIVIGEVQYRHAMPWQMVAVHVSVAGLVWAAGIALVWRLAWIPDRTAPGGPAGEAADTRVPQLAERA